MQRLLVLLIAGLLVVASVGAVADWHDSDESCVLCHLRAHSPGLQPAPPCLPKPAIEEWPVVSTAFMGDVSVTAGHTSSRGPPRQS
jgi:hypothetical protein